MSDSLSTRIFLPAFIKREGRAYDDLDFTLTRDFFNLLIDPYLKRILSLIDEAQINSELTFNQIDKLILVGGSSRIPRIREMISHHIGLNLEGYIDPEQSVSKGTAVYAGVLNGNVKDMLLLDVLQIPISIGDRDGNCEVIIPKYTTIPVIERKKF